MAEDQQTYTLEDRGRGNRVEIDCPRLQGRIRITGNDNMVRIADIARPGRVDISIEGDGCRLYLGRLRRFGRLRATLKDGGALRIGATGTIEAAYFLAQGATIAIGRDAMISFEVVMRTTDAHGIYDLETGALRNPPQDITLADHVWVGQRATLQKGAVVGASSVVGAGCILGNMTVPANAIVAGIPARVIDTGIVWDRRMTPNAYAPDADTDPHFAKYRPTPDGGGQP